MAQEDTVKIPEQQLPEVSVQYVLQVIRIPQSAHTHIGRKAIDELQPQDVGELLQKVEGTSLKSYGGLGGLKTVSVRGLGSQHTAISVDGFSVSDLQTGQVNLGQIQTDNIQQIILGAGNVPQFRTLLPVSSQLMGSSLLIETFENSFSVDSFAARAAVRYGSFDQFDGYGSIKLSRPKYFISGFGKYRTAEGSYKYTIKNGDSPITGVRTNSEYTDYYFGASAGVKLKERFILRAGFNQKTIDQELPGAVIFYNSTADEQLFTTGNRFFGDASYSSKNGRTAIRAYASVDDNSMRYLDPTFLNNTGGIDRTYRNQVVNSGMVANFRYTTGVTFNVGFEENIGKLTTTDSTFARPERYQSLAILGVTIDFFRKFSLTANASGQLLNEVNHNGESADQQKALNPFISLRTDELGRKLWRHTLWYRNSFRMPSFNELYYNNIGNKHLEPEKAHQFNYGISVVPIERKLFVHLRGNAFYNRISNKIVAIPTQNLFVWSIQNLGEVEALGGEFVSTFRYRLNEQLKLTVDANYTLQRTLDITTKEGATYRHQVAYIPVHTANADVSLNYRMAGLRISNYFVSKRYSLNQNIEANEVQGFIISDISTYYAFTLKSKQKIQAQLSVKNVFNSSYAYVRSYIMPGRNFVISLSYAFN